MRVALLALGGGGMLRYGLAYAQALSSIPGIEVLTIVEGTQVSTARGVLGQGRLEELKLCGVSEGHGARAALTLSVLLALRSFGPHVVHDTTGVGWSSGPFVWPLIPARTPLFITLHDPSPHSGMGRSTWTRFKRLALRHFARKVVVHGSTNAADAMKSGIRDDKLVVSQIGQMKACGAFAGQRTARPDGRDFKTVLFFGAFRPNKGMDLLAPIAERVHSVCDDARFVVAGSSNVSRELGGWKVRLESLLADMRSRPYFEVRDEFIPDSELPGLFEQADVVLLPYRDASQSAVLMTALAFGRPIVATNVGGIGDVIEHGHSGWLVECAPDDLAEAVVEALSQPVKAERLGGNARALAETVYAWEAIASDMVTSYRECATASGRSKC